MARGRTLRTAGNGSHQNGKLAKEELPETLPAIAIASFLDSFDLSAGHVTGQVMKGSLPTEASPTERSCVFALRTQLKVDGVME